jgi:hypothetical protein
MRQSAVLWLVLLAAPLVWFVSFQANFALAPWACTLRWKPALYGVSLAALALVAACGLTAWGRWRRLGREFPGEAGGTVPASRTLASGAVLLNAAFFVVILAQTIVEIILGACE